MLRRIELHGVLADKFGSSFELDVESPREAAQALSYQLDGFRQFMNNAHNDGLYFAIFNDDENIGLNEIDMQTGASTIHIVPEICGAGGNTGGILQVIAGAALIAVGVIGFGFTAGTSSALIGAGAGLLIGGAAQLLMPTPKIQDQDEAGNKASYGFGSAVTTVAQGNPVPIAYGRREIGGFVISAMVVNEDT